MPIFKKDQTLPAQPVIIMIYGDPGTSKTSLANTCDKPLILDFDRGFKRSFGRPDALILTDGWKEIEQMLADGSFNEYKTIVIDTVKGALDDFLMPNVVEKDYKLKTNKLKAYGELGEQFKLFINTLRLLGKDIFIIAHAKSQEDGDFVRKVADITGSSNALVLRIADQVGFLTMRNGKRVLTFNPTDTSVGKNVGMLKDMELPLHTDIKWNGYADIEIMQKVKEALSAMTESQKKAIQEIENWHGEIDAIVPDGRDVASELAKLMAAISDKVAEEHLKKQIKAYFSGHLVKIGWKYDGKSKKFVVNPENAKAEDKPVDNTPPVETQKELTPLEARIDQLVDIGLSWNEADRSFGTIDFKYISLESVESYDDQKWEETIKGISEHVAENTPAPLVEDVKSLIPPVTGPQITKPDMFAPKK